MSWIKENIGKSIGGLAALIGIITGVISIYESYQSKQMKDLSGKWDILFYIDKTSYSPYLGKNTTNRIFFSQENDKINANGEMTHIDGEEIPAPEHIPIHLQGNVKKDKIQILFQQDGAKRKTSGELNATISEDGNKMDGIYSSTAANTSGRIKGVKLKE